ncbi:Uu.00g079590.m01.CDS01 [Anthostomella pinea]|uniref:Uu.00g079590.m01.CDS01 n=1 Tax=Anthostomella pinea TaxID=933095 RepID=A0AAI8VFG1_9PEZI|nr:Uu.00g079590.m01.CDS01 [Anthostomella pinea]
MLKRHFPVWFEGVGFVVGDLRFITTTVGEVEGTSSDPFPELPWVTKNFEAYARGKASWKRMLVHQPPFYGLGLVVSENNPELMLTDEVVADGTAHGDQSNLGAQQPLRMEELLSRSLVRVYIGPTDLILNERPLPDHPVESTSFCVLWYKVPWWLQQRTIHGQQVVDPGGPIEDHPLLWRMRELAFPRDKIGHSLLCVACRRSMERWALEVERIVTSPADEYFSGDGLKVFETTSFHGRVVVPMNYHLVP